MSIILDNATLIGLLFFFGFFVSMVLWVFRPGSKKNYDKKAEIPLTGDEK